MIKKGLSLTIFLFIFLISSDLFASEFSHKNDTEYFSVYMQDGVDSLDVAYKIDIGTNVYLSREECKASLSLGDNPDEIFIQNVDALFNEVSGILDMHIYSYHGTIKVCPNKEELERVFYDIFKYELKAESFYHHMENTIYINAENLKPGILAHEMAHAIITHYFVVVPPVKAQEVLSGYVEYNINKKVSKEEMNR